MKCLQLVRQNGPAQNADRSCPKTLQEGQETLCSAHHERRPGAGGSGRQGRESARQLRARAKDIRRGSRQRAPAVPTGSTAAPLAEAGGRHQTSGPKTLPSPIEPTGGAKRPSAPVTERASTPEAGGRLGGPRQAGQPQVPGTVGQGHPAGAEPNAAADRAGILVFPGTSSLNRPGC